MKNQDDDYDCVFNHNPPKNISSANNMSTSSFGNRHMKAPSSLLVKLKETDSREEIQVDLDQLETLATEENALPADKALYGLAYLMEGKPWYDFKRGFNAVQEAAESEEPFCWFVLGSLYLNGKPELPSDPVSAKYWIDKAAAAGYKDAIIVQELQWGNNPEGFVEWFANRLEKENTWRRWIGIGLIVLCGIAAVYCIFRLIA